MPVVGDGTLRLRERVERLRFSRERAPDEIADAPQDECDETLRRSAHPFIRFVVHIELPGDEEEIVTHAVQQDRREDERRREAGVVGDDLSGDERSMVMDEDDRVKEGEDETAGETSSFVG